MTAPRATDVEAIWAELGTSLERFVRRHVADPHHAEDLVADVLARVHQHLGRLDDQERVMAWVWRITRNAITDHYRRTASRREVLAVDHDAVGDHGADTWIEDQDAAMAELASCVRPLLDALPADYRRALELTDLDGRTQADAARLEGISVSGMKSRVQRGRRLLAALVRDCCELTTDCRGEVMGLHPRSGGCGCSPACWTR